MAFTLSSRAIILDGVTLTAECRTHLGAWNTSSVDLDRCLSNNYGSFCMDGDSFSKSARDIRLDGSVLRALLHVGAGDRWVEAAFDLNLCVGNKDGVLSFKLLLVKFIFIPMLF